MDDKKNALQLTPPLSVVRGRQVKAEYVKQPIEEYQGNPLIEALPPLLGMNQVGTMLAYYPPYNESQRELPGEVRLHLLENAREFFIPQAIHYEIFLAISNMIRRGYIGRNPVIHCARAKQSADIQRLEREIQRRVFLRSKARGLLIVGPGGMGKSTAVENILSLFPQVITHTNYGGQDFILKQLVWIKLQCPGDGSLRGLCINFLQEVDDILSTNYMKFYGATRRTVDELLLIIARVSSLHCVGVVVFDEVQDLSEAKSGGAARMLNFFVQLENTLGIPFVLIATPKAEALFDSEFRHARRVSEQGDIFWRPMREIMEKLKADEPDRADPEWEDFVRAMCRYWYLKKNHSLPKDIMKDGVVRLLYETSQGITALVVTVFFLAQRRAIISGKEDLTEGVIKSAVRDNLFLVGRMLDELKVGPLRSQNKKGSRRGASDLNRSHWERRPQSNHRTQTVAAAKPPDPAIDQEAEDTMQEQSAPPPSERRRRRDAGRNTKTHEAGDLRGLTLEKNGRPSNSANPEIMAAPDEFAP